MPTGLTAFLATLFFRPGPRRWTWEHVVRIVNRAILADLNIGRPLRLNLGCGNKPRADFYGVDRLELPGVDIVANLNQPFTALPDNSVEAVYSRQTLEHVVNLLPLMKELHRVVRPGGQIEIIVPHFSNPYGFSDPTHVRFFGLYSFFYFCDPTDQPRRKVPSFYLPQRFVVEAVRCRLLGQSLSEKLLRWLLQPWINRGPAWLDWYERRWCRVAPASDIRYVLRPKKAAPTRSAG